MNRLLTIVLAGAILLTGCAAPGLSISKADVRQLSAAPIYLTDQDRSQDNSAVYGAIGSFGVDLLRQLRDQEGGQVLISPLSAVLALSMAANGAQSDTLSQFETLFGGDLNAVNRACGSLIETYQQLGGSTQCHIANSVWTDPEGQIKDEFVGKCQGIFDAQVFQADLSDKGIVKAVNGWVSDNTKKLIPSIIDKPFEKDSAALLINALYLKNTWLSKFDPNSTGKRPFTHADGKSQKIDFLNDGYTGFDYIKGDGVQGVVLPYDDGRLGFAALLPDGDLDSWLSGLTGEQLSTLVTGAEDAYFLDLGLPKFEQEWNGQLGDALKAMGLDRAFVPGLADFSALGDNPEGYFISQVIQATKIAVNEEGTEAAAATIVDMNCGAGMPPEDGVRLVFDRPFLYGIVDLQTGLPLFLGTFE